jgi:hypothetical protein
MLRWISRCEWIRKALVHVLGRQSRLVNTARLFLFGVPVRGSECADGPAGVEHSSNRIQTQGLSHLSTTGQYADLSSRARTVLALMSEMRTNDKNGNVHARRP